MIYKLRFILSMTVYMTIYYIYSFNIYHKIYTQILTDKIKLLPTETSAEDDKVSRRSTFRRMIITVTLLLVYWYYFVIGSEKTDYFEQELNCQYKHFKKSMCLWFGKSIL